MTTPTSTHAAIEALKGSPVEKAKASADYISGPLRYQDAAPVLRDRCVKMLKALLEDVDAGRIDGFSILFRTGNDLINAKIECVFLDLLQSGPAYMDALKTQYHVLLDTLSAIHRNATQKPNG